MLTLPLSGKASMNHSNTVISMHHYYCSTRKIYPSKELDNHTILYVGEFMKIFVNVNEYVGVLEGWVLD